MNPRLPNPPSPFSYGREKFDLACRAIAEDNLRDGVFIRRHITLLSEFYRKILAGKIGRKLCNF